MHVVAIPHAEGVNSLDEIPNVVSFIHNRFKQVTGINSVQVLIRGRNLIPVYVFVNKKAAEACESEMIFPREMGIKYETAVLNKRKHPRLWLEERRAEIDCEKHVGRRLTLEWVTFLKDEDGKTTPVG